MSAARAGPITEAAAIRPSPSISARLTTLRRRRRRAARRQAASQGAPRRRQCVPAQEAPALSDPSATGAGPASLAASAPARRCLELRAPAPDRHRRTGAPHRDIAASHCMQLDSSMCQEVSIHPPKCCPSLQAVIRIARSAGRDAVAAPALIGVSSEEPSGSAPSAGWSLAACTRAPGIARGRSRTFGRQVEVFEGEFRMARRLQAFLACWAFAMAFPALAAAQSAFTGSVKDSERRGAAGRDR